MLSPQIDTSPSAASSRQGKKAHEETLRGVVSSPSSYHRRAKRKQPKVSRTCFTSDLLRIGDPKDELSAKLTKSFEDHFIAHTTLSGAEFDNTRTKGEYRLTLDEIIEWAKSQRDKSDLDDSTFDLMVTVMKHTTKELNRDAFHKLECYAAARALFLRSDTYSLARLYAFQERCYAADEIIDKIAELFPDNLSRRRALAEAIYERGFMLGSFTRASECLAPLYGLLSCIGVPEPRRTTGLMLPGTNVDSARTMYEYLVDGYTHSTGLSYVNRFCRYRVLIVAGAGAGCGEYSYRLAAILKQWCFDVKVFTHLNEYNLTEHLREELDEAGDLSQKYDGCLFYFVDRGKEGVVQSRHSNAVDIQAIHDAVAGKVPDDLLKMFIFDSHQNEGKEGEPPHLLERIKPNVFILKSAPTVRAAQIAAPSEDPTSRVVSDEGSEVPCFTKAFLETLETTRGCVKLRDLVAQASAAMNEDLKEKGIKECLPLERGSTACKSIFLFPESVTAMPEVPSEAMSPHIPSGNQHLPQQQQPPPPQDVSGDSFRESMIPTLSPTKCVVIASTKGKITPVLRF